MLDKLDTLETCQLCGGREFLGLNGIVFKPDPLKATFKLRDEDTGWHICRRCSFVFQNPRLNRGFVEEFYGRSDYHQGKEIVEGQINHTLLSLARRELYLGLNGINIAATRNATCLDFGCGTGGALNFLAERGNEVWGVELDRREVEFGRKHYRINFVHNVKEIPEATRFDFIFTHHCLEHMYDPNDFFAYASRALKPGGLLMISLPTWRYSDTMKFINGFDISDNSMFDHVSLAGFLNKYGLFQFSHMYQNADDFELVALARKSPRKNHYVVNLEESLAELYGNVAKRHADRLAEGTPAANPIIVRM
ncbi:MAG: class I SAM-dependent methyltransferase [Fibrobacteres bacterium]|nr:class I SAM-dependent methyltransferase [Fibrobacterota bacterium]